MPITPIYESLSEISCDIFQHALRRAISKARANGSPRLTLKRRRTSKKTDVVVGHNFVMEEKEGWDGRTGGRGLR